jgi:hypothetical protein
VESFSSCTRIRVVQCGRLTWAEHVEWEMDYMLNFRDCPFGYLSLALPRRMMF